MIRELLMVDRVEPDGLVEAEPVVVDLEESGRMALVLDTGERLEFDLDDLLAIVTGEHVVPVRRAAA